MIFSLDQIESGSKLHENDFNIGVIALANGHKFLSDGTYCGVAKHFDSSQEEESKTWAKSRTARRDGYSYVAVRLAESCDVRDFVVL